MPQLKHYRRPLYLFALVLLIGVLVQFGFTRGFDDRIFGLFALKKGISPDWLIKAAQAISWIGGGVQRYILVGLLGLAFWLWRGKRYGIAMIGASLISSIISDLLKAFYNRPRPSVVEHLDRVSNASYPSGHATSAAAVYLLIWWLAPPAQRKYWKWPMLFLCVATGLSRIMLGVHWPSDVIGGWMLGAALAIAAVIWINSAEDVR